MYKSSISKLQKIHNLSKSLIALATNIYLIALLLPISYISSSIRTFAILTSFVTFYVAIVLSKKRKVIYHILIFTLIILVFNTLLYYAQWSNYTSLANKNYLMLLFWFAPILSFYYIEDDSLVINLYKLIILLLTITSITTIMGSFQFYIPSRMLAGAASEADKLLYYRHNIGGFGFCYSLVIAIPSVIFLYKITRKRHYLFVLVLFYFCIFRSEYAIGLLLALISLVLFFFKKTTKHILFYLMFLASGLILIASIFSSALANLFNYFGEYLITLGRTSLGNRFIELYQLFEKQELGKDLILRFEVYSKSLLAFSENPIGGLLFNKESGHAIGGHSEILDLLGSFGIILFLIFFSLMFLYLVLLRNQFYFTNYYGYWKYTIFIFTIISAINTVFVGFEISIVTFLLPISICRFEENMYENNLYNSPHP